MRLALLAILAATACSSGLKAINEGDTDSGVFNPDSGKPIDTGETNDGNESPVADAGADQLGFAGDVIGLDGTNSFDPDDDPLDFQWTMTSKPSESSTSLINETWADPEFWADAPGEYVISLRVSDGQLDDTDEVVVTIERDNEAPYADAGPDQSVSVGDTVQLNGSNSWDPDEDPLSFEWKILTKPSGSAAGLDDPTKAMPRFAADRAGVYEVQLVVNDGDSDSPPDRVRITAADAGGDDDCLSCGAAARQQLHQRFTLGQLAAGPGLVALPILALLFQRRRRREED